MSVRRLAEKQPKSFAFTADNLAWAKAQIEKYPPGRQQSAVIPILWRAQEQCGGWLPQKAIEAVAEMLGMAKIRVLEVATFYTMFNLSPVGKFHVQFCGTTPCLLRGADGLKKVLHRMIGEENAGRRPTASSPGSRSSAWAPASTRRWCRSMPITTRTSRPTP